MIPTMTRRKANRAVAVCIRVILAARSKAKRRRGEIGVLICFRIFPLRVQISEKIAGSLDGSGVRLPAAEPAHQNLSTSKRLERGRQRSFGQRPVWSGLRPNRHPRSIAAYLADSSSSRSFLYHASAWGKHKATWDFNVCLQPAWPCAVSAPHRRSSSRSPIRRTPRYREATCWSLPAESEKVWPPDPTCR